MTLAACYISWNDLDLLEASINNIRPLVDLVVVITSRTSNYGEKYMGPDGSLDGHFPTSDVPIFFRSCEPNLNLRPMDNETAKRNAGLSFARDYGATHFIAMDSDEAYDPTEFTMAKHRFLVEPNLQGLVCPSIVYFKRPTLCLGHDVTLVPHIHKVIPKLRHEFNRKYQHAWINGQIRIDPTRSLNINSGVEYTEDVVLHHYSWVRKDYSLKIRNSSAKNNLERSSIMEDLAMAKDGYFCKFYGKTIYKVENRFNMPDYISLNSRPLIESPF